MSDSPDPFGPWDIPEPKKPELPKEDPKPEPQEIFREGIGPLDTPPQAPLPPAAPTKLELIPVETPFPISESQKQFLDRTLFDAMTGGAYDAALVCRGAQCKYVSQCWFTHGKIPYPEGEKCPIELALAKNYVRGFQAQMGYGPLETNAFFDSATAGSLVALRLVIGRAMWAMAEDPQLQRVVESEMRGGGKITTVVGNLNAEYAFRAIERVQRIGADALLTRRHRAQILKEGSQDRSSEVARIQESARKHIAESRKTIKLDKDGLPVELEEVTKFESNRRKGE